MLRFVNLRKRISGEKLEEILIKAAKEIGLKAYSSDRFRTEYKLGSVKEEPVYIGTTIRLKKRFLPMAEIDIDKKSEENKFTITTRIDSTFPYFGFGSKRMVEKYLEVVSKYISEIPQP